MEMNHQLACDPEVGGCGKLNYIHHFLSGPPHVFMTGGSVFACGVLNSFFCYASLGLLSLHMLDICSSRLAEYM